MNAVEIRRRLSGLLLLLAIAGCTSSHSGGSARPEVKLERFEFSQPQMGMSFRIVLYATNQSVARAAAHAAFAEAARLNTIFSDYEESSELNRLSRTAGQGRMVRVSEDLWEVLHRAQEFSRQSDGAFDVTVGPVVQLWRRARRQRALPGDAPLSEAMAAVGWRNLRLDRRHRTVELRVSDMRLDVGGIAKGYALDAMLKVLRRRGVERALVTAGGDMAAGAPPPGKAGWRIEVAPLETNTPPTFLSLAHLGVATSGDLFQRVIINGKRYSHIVDPRTGLGLTDHSLVTVIARDATTADALATAVSVLGPKAGLKLIEKTPGAAAHIARQPAHEIEGYRSKHFQRHVERKE